MKGESSATGGIQLSSRSHQSFLLRSEAWLPNFNEIQEIGSDMIPAILLVTKFER